MIKNGFSDEIGNLRRSYFAKNEKKNHLDV
jgi:hypothetical protein